MEGILNVVNSQRENGWLIRENSDGKFLRRAFRVADSHSSVCRNDTLSLRADFNVAADRNNEIPGDGDDDGLRRQRDIHQENALQQGEARRPGEDGRGPCGKEGDRCGDGPVAKSTGRNDVLEVQVRRPRASLLEDDVNQLSGSAR